MSSLIPSGSASGTGSMTLIAPVTNSNQVVTLPDATGTAMVSGAMPAFSAYNNAVQFISQSTYTKIAFQVKEFDTNNSFDNSTNYRFQPTVAGYYQVSAGFQWTTSQGTSEQVLVIYKNGSVYKYFADTISPVMGLNGGCLVFLNGSSDYIEMFAYSDNPSTRAINGNSSFTYFQAAMVRAA